MSPRFHAARDLTEGSGSLKASMSALTARGSLCLQRSLAAFTRTTGSVLLRSSMGDDLSSAQDQLAQRVSSTAMADIAQRPSFFMTNLQLQTHEGLRFVSAGSSLRIAEAHED